MTSRSSRPRPVIRFALALAVVASAGAVPGPALASIAGDHSRPEIDTSDWSLVSNLAAGEAPRFAPTAVTAGVDAGSWSSLGSNGSGNGAIANGYVAAIAVSGSDVYVGGAFQNAAGIAEADNVARWNGSAWSALGSNGAGVGALGQPVTALAIKGSTLIVGGEFTDAGGNATADYAAVWNGIAWSALGSNGGNGALNNSVYALRVTGSDIFAGGNFTNAAGIAEADYVARWNGSAWSALGFFAADGALNSGVMALAGSSTNLYVGGNFTNAAGISTADYVAHYNGAGGWSALGSDGAFDGAVKAFVRTIGVSGNDVYVGGAFVNVAGIQTADYVARWNGSSWYSLGSNGVGNGALNNYVLALRVSGPDVFIGGIFTDAAAIAEADYVARWDGNVEWHALGSNGSGSGALGAAVKAIAPTATVVHLGGDFINAEGRARADRVVKWTPLVTRPDGRIRKGSDPYAGDNIYNTTGANQTATANKAVGTSVTFGLSLQNDGNLAGRLKVWSIGPNVSGYTIRFMQGTTDITAAVAAATYETPVVAPGATYLITAKVTVTSSAAAGSSVSRQLRVYASADDLKYDVIKFVVKRA